MDKLKPCPFCGGAAVIQQDDKIGYSAYCNNPSCFVMPSTWWTENEEDAVSMWNKRVELTYLELDEKLQKKYDEGFMDGQDYAVSVM